MSKSIKTLAVVTTLAAAAGLAYAQQTVTTPASAEPQNTTQGAVVNGTSSGANTYRSTSPTAVNNSEQAPNATSNVPQGAMGNVDSNNITTSPSNLNNPNVRSDATLSSDPALTERPARADRN